MVYEMRIAIGLVFLSLVATVGAQQSASVWDGVYSMPQADRGKALYGDKCASCHGAALDGNGTAPPLAGKDFQSNWNGQTAGDLLEKDADVHAGRSAGKLEPCAERRYSRVFAQLQWISSGVPGPARRRRAVAKDPLRSGEVEIMFCCTVTVRVSARRRIMPANWEAEVGRSEVNCIERAISADACADLLIPCANGQRGVD